jgi:hypothetical protein
MHVLYDRKELSDHGAENYVFLNLSICSPVVAQQSVLLGGVVCLLCGDLSDAEVQTVW